MYNNIVTIVSSVFYLGYSPLASGTVASFVGAFLYAALFRRIDMYIFVFIIVTALGFLLSGRMEIILNKKDPSAVVIDEVSGAMIAFFMLPLTAPVMITTFFLFRAFDMFKTFPADELQKMPGGIGIMMDDVVAGLYTNLVMHAALMLQVVIGGLRQ